MESKEMSRVRVDILIGNYISEMRSRHSELLGLLTAIANSNPEIKNEYEEYISMVLEGNQYLEDYIYGLKEIQSLLY